MIDFKAQISIAVLLRRLFARHTSDNVPLVHLRVDKFQMFKIVSKDEN